MFSTPNIISSKSDKITLSQIKKYTPMKELKITHKQDYELSQKRAVEALDIAQTNEEDWVTITSIARKFRVTVSAIQNDIKKGLIAVHPSKKSYAGGSLVYAPHANKVVGVKEQFEKAKVNQLFADLKIADISKYLVVDMQQKNSGLSFSQTQTDYLLHLIEEYFKDDFNLIPANLTLEEKIDFLKNNHK